MRGISISFVTEVALISVSTPAREIFSIKNLATRKEWYVLAFLARKTCTVFAFYCPYTHQPPALLLDRDHDPCHGIHHDPNHRVEVAGVVAVVVGARHRRLLVGNHRSFPIAVGPCSNLAGRHRPPRYRREAPAGRAPVVVVVADHTPRSARRA